MRIETEQPEVAEVDMTPMIDIVFQLIAFFMVITNFEQTQADERVKLPKDQLAKPPEVKLEHKLVLNIGYLRDKDGRKRDPDPFVFWGGNNIRVLDFGPKLNQENRLYKLKKQEPEDVTIVIRADADVPIGLVQELMTLARNNNFVKFSLKAKQSAD